MNLESLERGPEMLWEMLPCADVSSEVGRSPLCHPLRVTNRGTSSPAALAEPESLAETS